MPLLVLFPVCHNCQGAKLNNEELRPTVRTIRCQSNNTFRMGVDYQQLASDQQSDPEVQAYKTAATSLKIQDVPWAYGQFTVLCDTSLGTTRPIVPLNWRRHVFDTTHSLSHPGTSTTRKLITDKFVWHGMSSQINGWARSCNQCQQSKEHTHTRVPLEQIDTPTRRFQHVHIDLVGPLSTLKMRGYKYLLIVMDRFTQWPEVIPLKDIDTKSVARAYALGWVACFDVQEVMTSDRGSQFISGLWTSLSQLLGTQLIKTTAYHPQSNGFIERLHRTFVIDKKRLNMLFTPTLVCLINVLHTLSFGVNFPFQHGLNRSNTLIRFQEIFLPSQLFQPT